LTLSRGIVSDSEAQRFIDLALNVEKLTPEQVMQLNPVASIELLITNPNTKVIF
jgi:hypothetical protein